MKKAYTLLVFLLSTVAFAQDFSVTQFSQELRAGESVPKVVAEFQETWTFNTTVKKSIKITEEGEVWFSEHRTPAENSQPAPGSERLLARIEKAEMPEMLRKIDSYFQMKPLTEMSRMRCEVAPHLFYIEAHYFVTNSRNEKIEIYKQEKCRRFSINQYGESQFMDLLKGFYTLAELGKP